jgi:hypothetical protein
VHAVVLGSANHQPNISSALSPGLRPHAAELPGKATILYF